MDQRLKQPEVGIGIGVLPQTENLDHTNHPLFEFKGGHDRRTGHFVGQIIESTLGQAAVFGNQINFLSGTEMGLIIIHEQRLPAADNAALSPMPFGFQRYRRELGNIEARFAIPGAVAPNQFFISVVGRDKKLITIHNALEEGAQQGVDHLKIEGFAETLPRFVEQPDFETKLAQFVFGLFAG